MAIDFAAVKAGVSFEDAISFLKLTMKREGEQYRSPCPACRKGGDRALVVTPSKGFYCHSVRKGGDVISFVAHVQECGQRQAAEQLSEHFLEGRVTTAERKSTSSSTKRENPPRDIEPPTDLTHDHPVIEMLGLSPAVCVALGIGYTATGAMAERIVFPMRTSDGTIAGFIGLATTPDQRPLLKFPADLEDKLAAPKIDEKPKLSTDEMRKLLRIVA